MANKLEVPETPRGQFEAGHALYVYPQIIKYDKPKRGAPHPQYGVSWSWQVAVDYGYGDGVIEAYWNLTENMMRNALAAGLTRDSIAMVCKTKTADGRGTEYHIQHYDGPMKVWSEAEIAEIIGSTNGNAAPTPPPSGGAKPPVVTPKPPVSGSGGQPPKPPQQEQKNGGYVTEQKLYRPLSTDSKEAWLQAFRDRLELTVKAQVEAARMVREVGLQVSEDQISAIATSGIIETWRFFGAKGGIETWLPFKDITTRPGALATIMTMVPGEFDTPKSMAVAWMKLVAAPGGHYGAWQHAGAAAALMGIDSEAVYNDFDPDVLAQFTQALWLYGDSRDDDMTQDEALLYVAEQYDLPVENLKLEAKPE
jgi:hypothetical protein